MSIGIGTDDKIGPNFGLQRKVKNTQHWIQDWSEQLQIMADHQAEKGLLPFSVEEGIKKAEKMTSEASIKVGSFQMW